MATRPAIAGIVMSTRTPILLISILLLSILAPNVVAHEQKLYTIVIHEQGETQPVNLVDGKFLKAILLGSKMWTIEQITLHKHGWIWIMMGF